MIPRLPKKKQQRTSFIGDELHAFDLTWRNYIPSFSQLCCCSRNNRIRLSEDDDDDIIEPAYYNDHTLYRGEAIQNYLNNSRDLEFDSVLNQDPNQITTRNPFGRSSSTKKKKKKKKLAVMETDMEEDIITGYHIDQEQQHYYYNDDAEFLADDQIANLVYNQEYDEHGNIILQPQQQQQQQQFYAARTMPTHIVFPEEESSSSQQPIVAVEAAQTLLSNKLDDLTEKLTFIKNNIIQIRPTEEELQPVQEEDVSDDIDSITSEALNVYENDNSHQQQQQTTRYSTEELHLPSLANFVSDQQHPFTYFTEQLQEEEQGEQEATANSTLNVQNVLNISRKWLGV